MNATEGKTCIYPGCERPAAPPHPLGGPQPSFCEREEHNALSAHLERQRLAAESGGPGASGESEEP
jgi:colicin import membrane protein